MVDPKKIALVTGANKGIGKEICRQLAVRGIYVFLTARDTHRGEKAEEELSQNFAQIQFLQMDITDPQSISAAQTEVEKRFGRLDILINNAAILQKGDLNIANTSPEIVRSTLETNLIGSFQVTQAFLPLLKKSGSGRIVNISSGMGALNGMGSGNPAYRISKTALNAMTRILASELRSSTILVNSVSPGWVRTDMGGVNASRPVEKGAETAVWLALLPNNGPSGRFFLDKHEIPW